MKKVSLSANILTLVNKLKEIEFTKEMVNYINKSILNRFPEAKEYELTLNQYIDKLEDDVGQHTVVITSEISYFCVKSYLAFHANQFLFEKTNGLIKILNKNEYLSKPDFDEYKSLSFDVVFEVDGNLVPLEIKVSQGNGGFTRATHATSKVNDYLLISLDINRNVVLKDNVNIVNSIFVCVTNIEKGSWKGNPSNNSSWTAYKFKVYDSDNNEIDYLDGIIFGSLKKNKINYGIITKKV